MEALESEGFAVLPALLPPAGVERLRNAFERAAGEARGTRHVEDLPALDPGFDLTFTHPEVLAAARHLVGPELRVLVLSGRDPRPGHGAQGLHADWRPRAPGERFAVATAIWLLDEFTAENGATRVVPGSHLRAGPVPRSLAQPAARCPGEVLVRARAGDVLFLNGHVWHSGTRNRSDGPRRVVQCQFVAAALAPPGSQLKAPARLGAFERRLLSGDDAGRGG